MWCGFAPTAMRTPISRVRSVTLTSMMFMIPIPPTRSDTSAMLASSVVMVLVPSAWAPAISVRLRIEKSSSPPARMRCRSRKRSVTAFCARVVSFGETALTKIVPERYFWRPPWIFDWNVVRGTKVASS
jgi:hypothetical protein